MDVTSPIGSDSPPLRNTVLGFGASFLRGRPRAPSQPSHPDTSTNNNNNNGNNTREFARELSPNQARSPSASRRRRPGTGGGGHQSSNSISGQISTSTSSANNNNAAAATTPSSAPQTEPSSHPLGLGMLRRRRSATGNNNNNTSNSNNANATSPSPTTNPQIQTLPAPVSPPMLARPSSNHGNTPPPHGSHRIRLVPHLDSRRTLRFEPICRNLKDGDAPLRIGRFTDRSGMGLAAANALSSNKLAFKSKVVSRAHAEIWFSSGGFFIKDTKSSSGTFLNHVRLSPANSESRAHQIKDGDILQLGVDYQGGTEDMYKSVKIRIEVGREWQAGANAFNTNALNQLKSLAVSIGVDPSQSLAAATSAITKKPPGKKTSIPDCCICLFGVTIRQALFIAPCSHAFHYKCIRPLLEAHSSAFSCPLCRTFADLEEDVEVENEADDDDEELEAALAIGALEGTAVVAGVELLENPEVRSERLEREAGAETEVEGENGASGSGLGIRNGSSRTRNRTNGRPMSQMNPVIDLTEPDDAEDEEMMAVSDPEPSTHHRGGAAESEGEGSGSGSGSGGSAEGEMGMGGVEGGEETVGGKRKR